MTEVKINQEDREKIKNYCLMDDVFFRVFIRDNYEAAQLILGLILDKQNIKVTNIETQRDLKNLKGRSIVADFYGKAEGRPFDVEIENSKEGADLHRARYHSSMLDADSLKPGQHFTELPDSYVIFITDTDVLGYGDPIYEYERVMKGRNTPANDGSYIIYVNGEYRGNDNIGWLMHDFNCTEAEQMHFSILKRTAKFLKETEAGAMRVYSESERLINEGAKRNARKNAEAMIRDGILQDEKIAEYSGLTTKEISEIRAEMKTLVPA